MRYRPVLLHIFFHLAQLNLWIFFFFTLDSNSPSREDKSSLENCVYVCWDGEAVSKDCLLLTLSSESFPTMSSNSHSLRHARYDMHRENTLVHRLNFLCIFISDIWVNMIYGLWGLRKENSHPRSHLKLQIIHLFRYLKHPFHVFAIYLLLTIYPRIIFKRKPQCGL